MRSLNRLITKLITIYPKPLQRLLVGSVFISQEERFLRKERVDGSYDMETGEIILWHPENASEEDLFVVLTHEWGHKIYHEWLSDRERTEWLKARSQETIDFGLRRFYPTLKLPEEEYCTIFCLVCKKLYWRKIGMKLQSQKLSQKIKREFPRAASVVEKHIKGSSKKQLNSAKQGQYHITHSEVEMVRSWIQNALRH